MAYDGGYPQRQYNGPPAPRPPPQRQYPGGPPPQQQQQYNKQQYGQYQQDDYGGGGGGGRGYDDGYGGGGGGYDQGYGGQGQYDDMNYAPAPRGQPPPRDPYGAPPGGRGRGPPMPGGRGGPMQRPPTADGPRGGTGFLGPPGPGRGQPSMGPQGRGRPGFPNPGGNSDPSMNRPRQPLMSPQKSPGEPGFKGSPFPALPGARQKSEFELEQEILNKMGGMDISGPIPTQTKRGPGSLNGRRPPPRGGSVDDYGRPSMDSQRGPRGGSVDDYGRPSMDSQRGPPGPQGMPRKMPPQGFPDQRRGPPPERGGYGDYPDEGFGPPARTMTMPSNMNPPDMAPPHRSESTPYGAPVGRGMPPPRPSTAQGNRPPPQRMHQEPPMPQGGGYRGQEYDDYGHPDQGYGQPQSQPPRDQYDNFHGDYYDDRGGYDYPPNDYPPQQYQQPPEPDMPNFDAAPRGRSSFDLAMQTGPGPEEPRRGPNRFPEVNRTKSQPDLRQSQEAQFEMAPDAPPMPMNPYQGGYNPPRPNGMSPPGGGLPSNPRAAMQQSPPPGMNADSLPAHPAPVRAGHMPGSMANSKPPPVRNYGGTPVSTPPAATPQPIQGGPAPPMRNTEPPVTLEELERLRNMVKVNSQDQQSALRLGKKLIEAADVLMPNTADPKTRGRARERFLVDAQKILKKLSNAQNADAMFLLADSLGKGLFGTEPDNKEAFTMYQSAAKLGHGAAAYRTAVCCEIGNEEGGGTRKDPLKAIQWYKRAATLGDTPAMYKVGMILLKGLLGQPRNPREAITWLKRAAEHADVENPHALHELGLLYEGAGPNDVIVRDPGYAFQLFKQAADLGYKFSQFRLGCAYEYGLMGCPIDPRLSIMWYTKAATQEEHQSELALSGWYLTGSDNVLGQSDTEAYLWARKAAMAGLAKAEYAMGYFTEMGIGVPANMEDAKRWYWRAAAQDFPKARQRLEELKRSGKNGPRARERISRSKIGSQQEGECAVM